MFRIRCQIHVLSAEAETLKLALELRGDIEAVACGEMAQGLRSGVHLVIVRPAGEAGQLQPVLVNPWRKGAVWKQNVASFK